MNADANANKSYSTLIAVCSVVTAVSVLAIAVEVRNTHRPATIKNTTPAERLQREFDEAEFQSKLAADVLEIQRNILGSDY